MIFASSDDKTKIRKSCTVEQNRNCYTIISIKQMYNIKNI